METLKVNSSNKDENFRMTHLKGGDFWNSRLTRALKACEMKEIYCIQLSQGGTFFW